jgi:hypothetical protein
VSKAHRLPPPWYSEAVRAYGAEHFDAGLRKCKVVDANPSRERRLDWEAASESEFGPWYVAPLFGWIDEDPHDGIHVMLTPMNTAHAIDFRYLGCDA